MRRFCPGTPIGAGWIFRKGHGYAKEYLPDAQKAPSGRGVILKWESMEALMKWRNSPEYQGALKKGEKFAKYNIIAVNGVQPK